MIGNPERKVILASASYTRRTLLEAAGVPHLVEPSRIDENELKISLRAEGASAADIAEVLAEVKAIYVSRNILMLWCWALTKFLPSDRKLSTNQSTGKTRLCNYSVFVGITTS